MLPGDNGQAREKRAKMNGSIGKEIRDKKIYDLTHDPREDKKHVQALEEDAETFLEGIRRGDQDFRAQAKSQTGFLSN